MKNNLKNEFDDNYWKKLEHQYIGMFLSQYNTHNIGWLTIKNVIDEVRLIIKNVRENYENYENAKS
jgi:predicted methyltransferase